MIDKFTRNLSIRRRPKRVVKIFLKQYFILKALSDTMNRNIKFFARFWILKDYNNLNVTLWSGPQSPNLPDKPSSWTDSDHTG